MEGRALEFGSGPRQFVPDDGGSLLAPGNDAATNAERNAGPVRLDAESGDTFTASSNPVRQDNRLWPTLAGYLWWDTRFDRPCSITSPLNDI